MPNTKNCRDCKHCGMDMGMDPYCVVPAVTKTNSWGLSLSGQSSPTLQGGACPLPELPLFEKREV